MRASETEHFLHCSTNLGEKVEDIAGGIPKWWFSLLWKSGVPEVVKNIESLFFLLDSYFWAFGAGTCCTCKESRWSRILEWGAFYAATWYIDVGRLWRSSSCLWRSGDACKVLYPLFGFTGFRFLVYISCTIVAAASVGSFKSMGNGNIFIGFSNWRLNLLLKSYDLCWVL